MLKKLAEQTVLYGVSSVIAKLLNYLLMPFLTRIMSEAQYAVVVDLYSWIPFALVTLTLGLETGFFRFNAQALIPRHKHRIYATSWSTVSVAALLFFTAVALWVRPIADVMGYSDHPSYIILAAGIVLLDVVSAIPFVRLRAEGKARKFIRARIISVCIMLVLNFFFYGVVPRAAIFDWLYNPNFWVGYYLVANLISSSITLMIVVPRADWKYFFKGIDRRMLGKMMVYSMPLFISGIAGTANELIDRQFIKYLIPVGAMDSLGVYGAVVRLATVMTLFTQMYRMAAEPFFLSNFKKEDFVATNAEAMKYFIIISIFIFLGITLYSDIFGLILGRNFRAGMFILPLVLLANILAGIVFNLSFWYKQSGRTRFAIIVTGSGLVFTFAMGFALIPVLGYYGAAITRVVCEVAMVAVSYWLNQRFFPVPYNLRRIGGYVLLGAALYGIGFFTDMLPLVPKHLLNLLLVGAFVLTAVRVEKIDVAGLMRSALARFHILQQ